MKRKNKIQEQAHVKPGAYFPMQSYNGMVVADQTASLSQGSHAKDLTPIAFRRYTNMGYTDVQLHNGMGRGQMTGQRFPYFNQVYVWNFIPRIPGQTRGDVSGFVPSGPSQYNVDDWAIQGPGSQPEHPGGPGTVIGTNIINPMSG